MMRVKSFVRYRIMGHPLALKGCHDQFPAFSVRNGLERLGIENLNNKIVFPKYAGRSGRDIRKRRQDRSSPTSRRN